MLGAVAQHSKTIDRIKKTVQATGDSLDLSESPRARQRLPLLGRKAWTAEPGAFGAPPSGGTSLPPGGQVDTSLREANSPAGHCGLAQDEPDEGRRDTARLCCRPETDLAQRPGFATCQAFIFSAVC